MTPGQTASPAWRKIGSGDITEAGSDLWRTILLLWTVAGIITGGAVMHEIGSASLVSTDARADGSVMSFSSYRSGDTDITSRIFGTGRTSIDRDTGTGERPESLLAARAEGPLLIGEYGDITGRNEKSRPICVFANQTGDDEETRTEVTSSGILEQGSYARDISLGAGSSFITTNGTGLISLSHRLDGNESLTGRTVASGNLSVRESIRRDQGISPDLPFT